MYKSLCLLSLACLSAPVAAFYPIDVKDSATSNGGKETRDVAYVKRSPFYVWKSPTPESGDGSDSAPTLRIRRDPPQLNAKREARRGKAIKRENAYKVLSSDPPSEPNSMAIDQDGSDISYFSTIKFGSEGKPLKMLLDTGVRLGELIF